MKATTDCQGALQNPEAFIPDLSFSQTVSGLFVASLEPFPWEGSKTPQKRQSVKSSKTSETVWERLEKA